MGSEVGETLAAFGVERVRSDGKRQANICGLVGRLRARYETGDVGLR